MMGASMTGCRKSSLTARQQAILDYLEASFVANWRMPTIREIMAHTGLNSPNGVAYHLQALVAKGVICMGGDKTARRIQLVGYRVRLVPDSSGGECLDLT